MMPTPEHIQQVQQFTRGVTAEIVERENTSSPKCCRADQAHPDAGHPRGVVGDGSDREACDL